MKLTFNDLRSITLGAASVAEENGKIRFHRFTKAEELFYKQRDATFGRSFSARCSAPAGIKLCFATNSKSIIELDDGASAEPIRPQKKLLVYGDSITQGYDAQRPSNRYVARLAEFLGAEEINKANGGEIFVPELAKMKVDFAPDYITVAYGTNDWSTTDGQAFYQNAHSFYRSLSENYPRARIFAITPIWRANLKDEKPFGDFFTVEEQIREATAEYKNVTVISGFDLVSHNTKLFADLRLHPRDVGFHEYFENLSEKIGEIISCRSEKNRFA